ncbi:exonuclease subunit SbcD [Colwellia sp. D2M02]|uniref:exonuclease SbcCD subunit D C-terminal domain-containing protein n=1 Tax=Colwellia sp. D2M02 TaxID=2841562 RepID=UPI001C092C1C|nr:exonuclease SbcCD subunit D C-terminal domain-containing protein [Colwellia sp. D2M02]MBU2893376.1 exonuclease subunit SbcD [Colwellia sp. D2M02]
MRIIHTSDWHLGQYFYGKSRAKEHQLFLHWLITQVKQHQVDAIIVAGDIFDTSTPPSYARKMYFNFIGQMQALDCQLTILAGNHDSVAMLGESKTLLSGLSTHVITHVHHEVSIEELAQKLSEETNNEVNQTESPSKLESTEQVFAINHANGQALAVICAIPFVRPRDVITSKVGQSATQKQQSLQQAITEHYQKLYQYALQLVDNIEKAQGSRVPIIATGHLTALGVSMSDSQNDAVRDIYIGTLEAFPSSAFPPADYIALGHIHRAQKVGKTEHIRYCGSPIALSFDEAKQDKRVLLVDFSDNYLNSVTDLTIPCFQPLLMIKSTLELLPEIIEKSLKALSIDSVNNHQSDIQADDEKQSNNTVWLDIEIAQSDHLSDLAFRVNEIVADLPVEVLLVRRAKKTRQQQEQGIATENVTLNELSVDEVFSSRLTELDWQSDEALARKSRLSVLFKQVALQVTAQSNTKQSELLDAAVSEELAQVKKGESQEHTEKNTVQTSSSKSEPSE